LLRASSLARPFADLSFVDFGATALGNEADGSWKVGHAGKSVSYSNSEKEVVEAEVKYCSSSR